MQGLISEKSFAEILGELFQNKYNGILYLSLENIWKIIYIEAGSVKNVVSNQEEENIAEYLMSLEIISEKEVSKIQSELEKENIYEEILRLNILNKEELLNYREMLCKGIIFSLFNWLSGSYNFVEKKLNGDKEFFINFPIPEIILEGVKRINEFQFIQLRLGNLEQIPILSDNFYNLAKDLPLNPSETFIISRIDNKTNLKEIIEMTMLEEEEVCRCIFSLRCLGLLKLEAPEEELHQQQLEKPTRTYEEYRFMESVKTFFEHLNEMNDYEVLGVDSVFDAETLRSSFEELALKYDPQRYSSPKFADIRKELKIIHKRIVQAYINLSALIIDKPDETKYPEIAKKEKFYLEDEKEFKKEQAFEFFEKAKEFSDKGDYYQAVNLCQEAIKINDKVPDFYLFIADIYAELPRFITKAVDYYTKYLEISPQDIKIKLKLAKLYVQLTDYEKAKKQLQEIIEIEPDNKEAKQLIENIKKE